MQETTLKTDVLVIGAGLAGICAAIAAAREGCSVILLEKFLTLGGNSSADAGIHPSGAHRFHTFSAETGIIEEITETAAWYMAKTVTPDMHYNISPMWDTVLYQTLNQAGVTVLRSHYAREPVMDGTRIAGVIVEDTGAYKTKYIEVGTSVIDASGDGSISALAGAEYKMGREGKHVYVERLAPEEDSPVTMGSSLVGMIRNVGKPVEFIPPPGTPEFYPGYNENPRFNPGKDDYQYFFFPTETGGNRKIIEDEQQIYDIATMCIYSAWNRIKNGDDKEKAKNWELSFLGSRLCKRESRRFIGDYVLTQQDIESGKIFDDAIGYGGFALDIHYPRPEKPDYVKIVYFSIPPIYTIPYRSIYSKDVDNLFFSSRLMSISHIAHGSVRLQRTLCTVGQAAGMAAAMCKEYKCSPRSIYQNHIGELQQRLLRNDASIPGIKNLDQNDLAKKAKVSATSERLFNAKQTDEWVDISKTPAGIMLWDWPDKLDSVIFKLKNTGETPVKLKAELLLRKWPMHYKNHAEHTENKLAFDYENAINEVEWGFDNSKGIFEKLAASYAAAIPGENEITFNFNVSMIEKNECVDEERYIIIIENTEPANTGIKLAVENRFYDFARFVIDAGNFYRAYAKCPVFKISPSHIYGEASNLINGINRRFSYNPVSMWQSDLSQVLPQSVTFSWDDIQTISMVQITFDTIQRTYREMPLDCGKRVSGMTVRDYTLEAFVNDEWNIVINEKDNYHRLRRHTFPGIKTEKLKLTVNKTWNNNGNARIYEVRIY
ncbi:MAG: FAD-dependent oxidoreductase [Treponema sp.]|nr:FAD-dependent oxidoreductase [Treponema sp.]